MKNHIFLVSLGSFIFYVKLRSIVFELIHDIFSMIIVLTIKLKYQLVSNLDEIQTQITCFDKRFYQLRL